MTPAPVGLRCPEHSGKAQGVQRVTRPTQRAMTTNWRRANAVTMGLIALNVCVYLAELAIGGTVDGTNNWIFDHGALFSAGLMPNGHVGGVAEGDWWRVVTTMFLHYGPIHLGINMYSLFYAGTLLEHMIGRWRFLLLYFASGIAGSAGALLWSPNSITVGASGAIFGILGALFVLERRRHIATGGQIAMLIVLNLVFTFGLASFISVGGHIGGLIGGCVLMWLMLHFRSSRMYSVGAAAAIVIVAALIAYYRTRGYA